MLDEARLPVQCAPQGAEHVQEEAGHDRRRRPAHHWSDNDTKLFYNCLSVFGTDFSAMSPLFIGRDRCGYKSDGVGGRLRPAFSRGQDAWPIIICPACKPVDAPLPAADAI